LIVMWIREQSYNNTVTIVVLVILDNRTIT